MSATAKLLALFRDGGTCGNDLPTVDFATCRFSSDATPRVLVCTVIVFISRQRQFFMQAVSSHSHLDVQKQVTLRHNFDRYWPILKILLLLNSAINLRRDPCYTSPPHLTSNVHKIKKPKVSICLPRVKLDAKILWYEYTLIDHCTIWYGGYLRLPLVRLLSSPDWFVWWFWHISAAFCSGRINFVEFIFTNCANWSRASWRWRLRTTQTHTGILNFEKSKNKSANTHVRSTTLLISVTEIMQIV